MLEKYLICDETSGNPDFSRRKSGVRVPSAPPNFETKKRHYVRYWIMPFLSFANGLLTQNFIDLSKV